MSYLVSGRFNQARPVLLLLGHTSSAHILSNLLPQTACVHPHLIKSNNNKDDVDDDINKPT